MFFPPLNIMLLYGAQVASGIVAGLLCKAYFTTRLKSKMKECQTDMIKSRQRIVELEALNEKLIKRLHEMENYFSKDSINMN